jgi:UDP-glucose 4-epimerase
MEPVLVTGTSGLVGYEAASQLHAAGIDVLGLDVRPAPLGTPFRCEVGDVADLATVTRLLRGRPNLVHAAAISGPMLLLDNPYGIAQANLGGAMAVFEAAYRAPVRRLVWLSSIAVYGDQPGLDPLPESARPNPQSFYGHTKVAGETLLHAYVVRYGLNAVALRLSSVFGVRRQTACALRALIEAGLQGRPARVAAAGSSFRQYLHVRDAANSVVLALAADALPGFVYNVTGGSYVTEAEIAGMIQALLPGLVVEPGPPAWNEGHLGPLVIDAAARDLGYRPRVSLADGLAELCAHLRARDAA